MEIIELDEFAKIYLNNLDKPRFEILKEEFKQENFELDSPKYKDAVIALLNIAVVDEQLAELNYLASYNLSATDGKTDFDPEFKAHEEEEREHKYKLINRLRELNAKVPAIEIWSWQEVNSQGKKWKQEFDSNSIKILKHRFDEEVDAVKFYELCAKFLVGSSDTTTYDLFKEIKEDEEQHVLDLRDLGLGVGVDIEA